jgi:hypothetical protein
MLFATPFGTDDTNGDSVWNLDFLQCDENDDFDSLKAKLIKESNDENSDLFGFLDDNDYLDELVGFWVVDEKIKIAIYNLDVELGNDSAVYRHISTIKQMVKSLAIKTVVKS